MPREKKNPESLPSAETPQDSEALAVLPPDQPETPLAVLQEKEPSSANETQRPAATSGASWVHTLMRILVFLLKLGLFLLLLAALAAGAYFGWPIIDHQYVLPVQNHTAQLAILETQAQQDREQLSALQTRVPLLATGQAQQATTLTEQASNLQQLKAVLESQNRSLADLQATQTGLRAGDETRLTQIEHEVVLLKSMELLSRARLFLYQSNFGLAKQDVQAARELLASLLTSSSQPADTDLAEVVQRLDLTLSRLPDFPVPASGDLDIAWQILLQELPQGDSTPFPPALSETPTPTPYLPVLSLTPTFTPSVPALSDTPTPVPFILIPSDTPYPTGTATP